MLLGCESSENKVYKIGDPGPSRVGIVFYTSDGGLHGLESATALWAGGTAIGTGFTNSDAIITQEGHLSSGASLCRNYTGGLKTDWFLPSQDELNQMYLHKDTIGGIDAGQYWSSTEGYSDVENLSTKTKTACFQTFSTGTPSNGGYKNAASASSSSDPDFGNYIRPIRAF